jgi:hypothetical protein
MVETCVVSSTIMMEIPNPLILSVRTNSSLAYDLLDLYSGQ